MILWKGKEGWPHVLGKDIQNVFQNLFKQRGKWKRYIRKNVISLYSEDAPKAKNREKLVIFMADGVMHHGGLCDRLKGIISVYSICKSKNIPFRIFFVSPFPLYDYLLPNQYDWKIDESDICRHKKEALPVFCGNNGTHVETPFLRRWLVKNVKKDFKQIHIYTNVPLIKNKKFSILFNELFKPSDEIIRSIKDFKSQIKPNYVTASFRFSKLLGDFKDEAYSVLDEEDRISLMNQAKDEIIKLREKVGEEKDIVLMSDSSTFIKYTTTQLPYVKFIPGVPVHMDFANSSEKASFMKDFLDLLVISEADDVYLFKNPQMYNSAFPRIGALIGNRPFHLIRFGY